MSKEDKGIRILIPADAETQTQKLSEEYEKIEILIPADAETQTQKLSERDREIGILIPADTKTRTRKLSEKNKDIEILVPTDTKIRERKIKKKDKEEARVRKRGNKDNEIVILTPVGTKSRVLKLDKEHKRIVIRQYHRCVCCRFILPLLLILLICLGLHFLESIARSAYSMFFDEFGKGNFVVDVPRNNQTVDICVRDYGCVDGDKISLSINSQEVFKGELFWENTCVSSKVNAGDNTITMYAINGTGGKGNCPNNVNTGEISIGKLNWEKRQWGLSPNTERSATLQINVKR